MKRPRVGIDASGGDTPETTREAALLAAAYESNLQVVVYGEKASLQKTSETIHCSYGFGAVEIVECPNHVAETSRIAADLKAGHLDAWVTPTASPRLLAAFKKAELFVNESCSPALMAPLPTKNKVGNGRTFLADVGLTGEVHDPEVFVQWAFWGVRFLMDHFGITQPRVGLFNIAVERATPTIAAIHKRLQEAGVPGYFGYAEPRAAMDGEIDLWLAEGLIGNGLIKTIEAWLGLTSERLRERFAQIEKMDAVDSAKHSAVEVFGEMLSGIALISPIIGLKDGLVVCRTHGAAKAKQMAGGFAAVRHYLK